MTESSRIRARLGQRIIHLLNTLTPAGVLYEVDISTEGRVTASRLVHGSPMLEQTARDAVVRWMTGTGLRPLLTALGEDEREALLADYRERVAPSYPEGPHGTVLPYRRIFAIARREVSGRAPGAPRRAPARPRGR